MVILEIFVAQSFMQNDVLYEAQILQEWSHICN